MSIATVNLENNPWQCDCRMVPFRQKMVGKLFEDNITCVKPSRFLGQKLKDINPDDLICEEPLIVRFNALGGNRTLLEGETLFLMCDVSGIPTPDITVTLPSGRNATVESGGRVTVGENGTITIENITATDSGLYVCLAASPVGSTSAKLSIHDPIATVATKMTMN
ncbi:biological adhesion [Branchiostoma belcheri]|nr:biological adhesion [Branchiostoma belcheri]